MNRLTTISLITGKPMLSALAESCGESACGECCEDYGQKECQGCPVQDGITKLHQYEDLGFDPEELKNRATELTKIQKAFALACRLLDDVMCCPCNVFDGIDWPECDGETGTCGDRGKWKCWQKYFIERAEAERVCRVCGCTDDNACLGGCSWVEPDLCSNCFGEEES